MTPLLFEKKSQFEKNTNKKNELNKDTNNIQNNSANMIIIYVILGFLGFIIIGSGFYYYNRSSLYKNMKGSSYSSLPMPSVLSSDDIISPLLQ